MTGEPASTPVITGRGPQTAFVILLGGVMALSTLLAMALGVLAPFLVDDLGLSTAGVGVLTSLLYLAGAFAAPSLGRVTDLTGPRRAHVLLMGTVALSLVIVAAAPGLAVVVIGALVGGVAMGAANPVTNRAIAELLPAGRRGAAMGWKQAGVPAAAFGAGVVLPTLAEALGWRQAVLLLVPLPLLAGAATMRLIPLAPPPVTRSPGEEAPGPQFAVLRQLSTYAFFMGAAGGAVTSYSVLYAVDESGVTAAVAGLIAAASGAAGVAARVVWGRLGEQREESRALLALLGGGALVASGVYALGPVLGVGALWIGSVLVGVSLNSWQPLAMMAIVALVPLRQLGAASGAVMRAFYGGYLIGPVAFGLLADRVGYSTAWIMEILTCLAATIVVARPLADGRGARRASAAES